MRQIYPQNWNLANKWSEKFGVILQILTENLNRYFRFSLVKISYITTGQLITFFTIKILRI